MRYAPILCCSLFFSTCTCEVPLNEEKIEKQIDERLESVECKVQTRLSNALALPIVELCNGKDDNCNGETDEGLELVPCKTDCGSGYFTCIDGNQTLCDAPFPQTEECNLKDDDCDGVVDEITKSTNDPSCNGGYEKCINGIWKCQEKLQVMVCEPKFEVALSTSMKGQGISDWSFALHPREDFESHDRFVTIATLEGDKIIHLSHLEVLDGQDADEMWTYWEEELYPINNLSVRADSYQNKVVVGVEKKSKTGKRAGNWYVFKNSTLSFSHFDNLYTIPPQYGFTPIAKADITILAFRSFNSPLAPATGVAWMYIPPNRNDIEKTVIAIANPFDFDIRDYNGQTWFTWIDLKGNAHVAPWDPNQSVSYQTKRPSEGKGVLEVALAESLKPHVAQMFKLHGAKQVLITPIGDDIVNTLPHSALMTGDHEHLTLASLTDGYAIVTGIPEEKEGNESSYLTISVKGFYWQKYLGNSRRVLDRAVTVTNDLGGHDIYSFYDHEDRLMVKTVRCE